MTTSYHSNGRVKWSLGNAYHDNGRTAFSLGTAYHENGRTAFSLGTAYHSNGRTALSLGTVYHSNGRTAYSLGTAYHSNGRTAYSLGTFYDEDGRIVDNKSFSIGLGKGIQMQIIPTIKIQFTEERLTKFTKLPLIRVWRNGGLRLNLKFRLSILQKANYIDFFS